MGQARITSPYQGARRGLQSDYCENGYHESSAPLKLRHHLLLILFFWVLAILITFPLVLNLGGQIIGHHTGDAYEMGHHIWWFKYAIQNGEPLFYQTLLAYPDGIQGISLWSNPTQFFPAWALAFVMPVAAAYNVQVLLTMALNGWAMAFLMRFLLQRESSAPLPLIHLPSVLAGVIFMSFPTFQGHLFGGHAGLMVMWPVPLLVWALYRLIDTRRSADFARAVLFFLLSPGGHTLQVIYVLLPLMGLFWLWMLVRRDWRGLLNVTLVGLIGGLLLIIFLIPVVQDTFGSEAYTGDGGYVRFSTDLLGIVTPSFEHVLFGQLDFTHQVLGVNIIESFTYLGIVAGVLALIAAWTRRSARYWVALALLTWALALGPVIKVLDAPLTFRLDDYESYITSPAALLYQLPGLSLARTPARFTFAFALAVAALAGYGAFTLMNRWPKRGRALLVIAGLFALFEYQAFWPYATVTADVPPAVQALRTRDDVRAVMDMPWGNLLAAKEGMFLQTEHHKPLIAGQVTRGTPVSPAKLTLLEETLDPALMNADGVDVVMLHKRYASDTLIKNLRDSFGSPTYEDERLALFDVPDTQAAPQFVSIGARDTTSERPVWHFYAPAAGWYRFEAALSSPNTDARAIALRLNDAIITRATLTDAPTPLDLPLYVDSAGYHTLTLDVVPRCPRPITPNTLICPLAQVTGAQLTPLDATSSDAAPITFDDRVTLDAWQVTRDSDSLTLWLAWSFDAPRSAFDVRFIKVLDADGQPIAEVDAAFARVYPLEAGERRFESLTLPLESRGDAPLSVYVGWYTLPDVTRFAVLSPVDGASDGWARLAVLE